MNSSKHFVLAFLFRILVVTAFTENLFNKGWFEYIADEISEFHEVPLSWESNQTIPSWLSGSYIKNGPARRTFDGERYYSNYLDGWAKLHKFAFKNGRVLFSGKMLEGNNYNKSRSAGHIIPSVTLGPVRPNDWNVLEMLEGMANDYDNTNVLTYKLGSMENPEGDYFATTDYVHAYQFDPKTLNVIKMVSMDSITLQGLSLGGSSHWKREVNSDAYLSFFTALSPITFNYELSIWRIGNSWEDKKRVGGISLPFLPFVHQISNTEHYAVIMVYPVGIDIVAAAIHHNFHPMGAMTCVDQPVQFYLMDLRDGAVIDGFQSIDPSIHFAAHHINAYEENNQIVLDISTSPWDIFIQEVDIDIMKSWKETGKTKNKIKRIRLDLSTKNVIVSEYENELNNYFMNTFDFPSINPNYNGRKHRYVYGWVRIDNWVQMLVKKDVLNTTNDKYWSVPSHYPGEMLFIPNPDGTVEDDGILITVVFDGINKESYLMLLDGLSFEEINRAHLPYTVPFSFHGNWFPNLQ